MGGASSIAAGIAPAIESAGGQIIFSADVSEILLDRSQRAVGVRMQDGSEFAAGTVISDAGAWNTFSRLLPPEAPGVAAALAELQHRSTFHGPPVPLRGRETKRARNWA